MAVNPVYPNTQFLDERKFEIKVIKSQNRVALNLTLLQIAFGIFTFIIAFNPAIFSQKEIIAVQLVCTIPLLIGSIFARKKLAYASRTDLWNAWGYITFMFAYSFLINVVGIFLALFVGIQYAMWFFAACIVVAVINSVLEILESKQKLFYRILKDAFFVTIITLLGILPALGVY